MLTYDGQQWNENILTDIQSKDVVRLVVKDRIPYVFWTSGNEKTLQAAYLKDDRRQKLASTIGTDINGFDIFCGDNTLYAVGATTNGIASVKTMKTVEGIPDPPVTEPEVGNGNVVLALPAGYDSSAKIYIDGVEAASTAWQNDEARRLVAINSIVQWEQRQRPQPHINIMHPVSLQTCMSGDFPITEAVIRQQKSRSSRICFPIMDFPYVIQEIPVCGAPSVLIRRKSHN